MKRIVEQDKLRPSGVLTVEELSGQDVRECYQCGKCSAGCPIASEMDRPPNQVIRLLQLGLANEALQTRTIWLCASCETCTTRCPREVDLAAVMDGLRNLAIRQRLRSPERTVTFFNRTFLCLIKKYGRVFEMELIGRFNVGTLNFFKDVLKAPQLLLRGRLKLWPSFKGRKMARSVWQEVKRLRSEQAHVSSDISEQCSDHAAKDAGPDKEDG